MNVFTMHPGVYSTGTEHNLINILEKLWLDKNKIGNGTIYIISGFANYNGGIRFYPVLKEHVRRGGKIIVFLGGSTSQRLSSKQVVEQLLECGAEVNIINRKRLLHSKCYGYCNLSENRLVVTSGNFTGPGMSQNVESAISLDTNTTNNMGFSWNDLIDGMKSQNWDRYTPVLNLKTDPAWDLLYDEENRGVKIEESQEVTMILKLVKNDTRRIMVDPPNGAGSQYFFLSKYCFDFFPPLTEKNKRGTKNTYSTIIELNYVDLDITCNERVTFEADNNVDFRLGTGKLRYTKLANEEDLAAITRTEDRKYELRIIRENNDKYDTLKRYAINYVGNRGKQYGFISNSEFYNIINDK